MVILPKKSEPLWTSRKTLGRMVDAIVDVTDGERGSIPPMVFHYNIASAP